MVKVTSPDDSLQIVPTQANGVTLVFNEKGFHFRRYAKAGKFDPDWAYIYGQTKQLAQNVWNALTLPEKVAFNNSAKTYHRQGQELYVQEIEKSVFASKFGEGKFGSVRFS